MEIEEVEEYLENAADHAFRQYATSTALAFNLSKKQCLVLKAVVEKNQDFVHETYNAATWRALQGKGLVTHRMTNDIKTLGWKPTRAGKLIYDLIILAKIQ